MSCIKCGKEVSGSNVFCNECLAEMEKYPVKPGTPLMLPNRPNLAVTHKRPRRRFPKAEEKISGLKNTVTWLCVLCGLLLVSLVLSVMLNILLLSNSDILPEQSSSIGDMFDFPFDPKE